MAAYRDVRERLKARIGRRFAGSAGSRKTGLIKHVHKAEIII